jgi:hypothetical protein
VNVEGITWHAIVLEPEPFAATKALMTETFGLAPAMEAEGMVLFIMPNGTMLELNAPRPSPNTASTTRRRSFRLPGGRRRGRLWCGGGGGVRAARRDHPRGGDVLRLPTLPRSGRPRLRPKRAEVARALSGGHASLVTQRRGLPAVCGRASARRSQPFRTSTCMGAAPGPAPAGGGASAADDRQDQPARCSGRRRRCWSGRSPYNE